jgi:hypothetical protein
MDMTARRVFVLAQYKAMKKGDLPMNQDVVCAVFLSP